MNANHSNPPGADTPAAYSAFAANRKLAHGALPDVARAAAIWQQQHPTAAAPLVFDRDAQLVELDLRGSADEVARRTLCPPATASGTRAGVARSRGRPPLGVVAREVTLLPSQWQWLAQQPGGASVTLRRLVLEARRRQEGPDATRDAQARTYRFINAMAGDLPQCEEALRALFGRRGEAFAACIAGWPADVRAHVQQLAATVFMPASAEAAA